jgi:hypothetical protein
MPNPKDKLTTDRAFGVYQKEAGSYTMAGNRFEPLKPTPVPAEVANAADPDESPVRFFGTEDDAKQEVARLKRKFDEAKPKAK